MRLYLKYLSCNHKQRSSIPDELSLTIKNILLKMKGCEIRDDNLRLKEFQRPKTR